jgi:hypothetical protein
MPLLYRSIQEEGGKPALGARWILDSSWAGRGNAVNVAAAPRQPEREKEETQHGSALKLLEW